MKSAFWRQILASILETELVTVNTTEGAAYGAALLAGGRRWETGRMSLTACQAAIVITGRTQPDPEQVAIYQKQYPIYQALYPALASIFHKM